METKIYYLEHLDCANCAAKIESKINSLPQVASASITFTTRQMRLTAEDPDALIPQLQKLARTVESGVTITLQQTEHSCHHDHCHCTETHHHHAHPAHNHQHHDDGNEDHQGILLLILGGCFLLGAIFQELVPYEWIRGGYFGILYLLLGGKILKSAAAGLVRGHVLDENFLMSIATLGAFAMGDYPEAVGVMLFFRVGEFFEHRAVARSRGQIMEAVDMRPETVTLADGRRVNAAEAQVGDWLLIRPGDRIPLDGAVVSGESRIDTAPITGEPVPVGVGPGDPLTSGCINTIGQPTMCVEKPLSESMVTRILNSVENAAATKPKIDRFITRFARVYTPIVVALAAAVAVIPSVITGNWDYWVYTALSFLVMSCPCALVLSVPLAFFSGIGTGGRKGVLFKGDMSIEVLANVKTAVMDKTGTLTQGKLTVTRVDNMDVLPLCAAVESVSTHPIGVSIVTFAREQGWEIPCADSVEELAGMGIRGVVNGKTVLCGNEKLMAHFDISVPTDTARGMTRVLTAVDGVYTGMICLSDTIKPGAAQAVDRLKTMGITPAILTGDESASAERVGRELGITRIYARLLPDEKLTVMQDLRSELGATLFVGDGINDAPVLSGADVGAAMGSGADAAIEAADVVFMTAQPEAIPEAIAIARQTKAIAWQNVVFALGMKLLVMALGLMGYASMWAAVFADSGVAMLCVLNSIRLLYKKRQ